MVLASGESLNLSDLTLLSSPAPGSYFVRVGLAPAAAGHVIISGTAGNFTKVIKSGETLPGTTTQWSAIRSAPSVFIPTTLEVTRAGQPVINTITADDSMGHVGVYRNSAWEATQVIGMDVPGFPVGSRFRPVNGIKPKAGNSHGQFVITNTVFDGTSNSSASLGQAAFLGQNGSLQMIMKDRDILAGDSRRTFMPTVSSINDSGTAALSGFYQGAETGAGWVYRWSATGGASKVISAGDALPSVGPKAIFHGCNTFQLPLINNSGAVLFVGNVDIAGSIGSSLGRRATLLYQSAPGAPIQKVARAGETVTGLPESSALILSNSDVLTFNDAGHITFTSLTAAPQTSTSQPIALFGGLAPNVSVIARVGTPLNVNERSGSSVFASIVNFPSSQPNRMTGEFGSTLSSLGDIYFRGAFGVNDASFGRSTVFRAQLSGTQSGTLSPQVISFPPPRNVVVSAPAMALAATSSSGLPVTFSLVSGPATLAGNTLNFSASTGQVVIRADQGRNTSFLAAPTVEWKFNVVASAANLPYVGPALLVPLALPGNPAPGGGTYSGVDSIGPLVTAEGEVTFNDAITATVINGEATQARLNLYQSTVTGLVLNSGEQLDLVNPTVLSHTTGGNYFLRVPITSSTFPPQEALITGTPGNFSKILRTGDVLPGTTSIWAYNSSISPQPLTTRGGAPIVYATSADGLSSHVGIYRNGAWENTQIIGTAAPGYGSTSRFADPNVTAANQSGQFLFLTRPQRAFPNSGFYGQALFLGQNGNKQLIIGTELNTNIVGDTRGILRVAAHSLNSSGTSLVYGDYTPIAGNTNQGGFLYRWSSAGGFSKVAVRGELLPGINSTAKFYAASREPLINDAGAALFFASVDLLGTGVNYNEALLYQAAPGAVIQKVAVTGEFIPGFALNETFSLNGIVSLHFNEAGQFSLFTTNNTNLFAGTAPNIARIAGVYNTYIEGLSGPRLFNGFPSFYLELTSPELHGVAGEFGARISNNGLIPFRSRVSFLGSNDTGVFVAKLSSLPPPAPVAQTITFTPLTDRLINSTFTPVGTTTSGLPISYQIISGPASISGGNITTTGTSGLVTVRASQAGNASFLAASPVDRTFRVTANASELAMTNYLAAANVPPENRLPNLDLDGDGLSNLLEFALGAAPLMSDMQVLPSVKILNGQFCFTYTRAQQASINYRVTATPDLANLWSDSGVDQGTVSSNGLTVASISAAASSRFLRLEVTLKP